MSSVPQHVGEFGSGPERRFTFLSRGNERPAQLQRFAGIGVWERVASDDGRLVVRSVRDLVRLGTMGTSPRDHRARVLRLSPALDEPCRRILARATCRTGVPQHRHPRRGSPSHPRFVALDSAPAGDGAQRTFGVRSGCADPDGSAFHPTRVGQARRAHPIHSEPPPSPALEGPQAEPHRHSHSSNARGSYSSVRGHVPLEVCSRKDFTLAPRGRRLPETSYFRGDCGQERHRATEVDCRFFLAKPTSPDYSWRR